MVTLKDQIFGSYTYKNTGKTVPVQIYTWENENNISVQVMNWGATVVSIKVPDKNDSINDVVMGFRTFQEYLELDNPGFGRTIGRAANRLRCGKYTFKGETIQATKNYGPHHHNGGFVGFDKVLWNPLIVDNKLVLSYYSKDGEEGFPGDLVVFAVFELTDTNEFSIEYTAATTKPTYVNITNKSYFNLAAHDGGPFQLYKHLVIINADRITEKDIEDVSTGRLIPVDGTEFDFVTMTQLETVLFEVPGGNGFDHNFCVNNAIPERDDNFVARVYYPENGRLLDVFSNQPGLQFSTANELPQHPTLFKGHPLDLPHLRGKVTEAPPAQPRRFSEYYKNGAFSLQPQIWPDAPNHEDFPNGILRPGDIYRNFITYKFSVIEED